MRVGRLIPRIQGGRDGLPLGLPTYRRYNVSLLHNMTNPSPNLHRIELSGSLV